MTFVGYVFKVCNSVVFLCFLGEIFATKGVPENQVVTVEVQAVEGKSVELPCNVTPPGHDKVYMVFWFKADAGIPLYSFDVRGKPLVQARHWSSKEVFGDRAYFRTATEPARLVLEEVRRHDEGLYRCRVDFRNTPTRSFRYNLTVTVLPEYPAVFDRYGILMNGSLGPYKEGDNVSLTCRVIGGKPEPLVRWLVNGKIVDEEYEHNSGDVIENRFYYPNIQRKDLDTVFSCEAFNTNLTDPRETSLVLDMNLKPLTVQFVSIPESLVADIPYEVTCQSTGSRPPAVITWYKGRKQQRKVKDEVKENHNMTTSVMSFVPSTDDDGKVVTCRAENPNVKGLYHETLWTLQVVYPPIVSLRLGSTLNASDIKEGDDVYFECHVRSNPPLRRLTWLHNDVLLNHNVSARLILINQSLVLQRVTRQNGGIYSCVAFNQQGETRSNQLNLRVKYSPTCRQDRILVVGASRSEKLDIACEVEADPPARSFRWKFNNSGETLDVGPERYSSNGTTSILRYTPVADLDYGTLSCWADNAIGSQLSPCLFQVVAAGKPFPVRNCTLSNLTSNSVEICCQAGFDGGLPQVFLLELYTSESAVPRYNLTSDSPNFYLTDLEPDTLFRVVIYAFNSKGTSQGAFIEDFTFRDPEKRTGPNQDMTFSPAVGVAAGAALTFLLTFFVIMVIKLRKSNDRNMMQNFAADKSSAAQCKKAVPRDSADEKDPDLIPAKFDPVYGNGNAIRSSVQINSLASSAEPAPWKQKDVNPPLVTSPSYTWDTSPSAEVEYNGTAIKERLMANRLPESCV